MDPNKLEKSFIAEPNNNNIEEFKVENERSKQDIIVLQNLPTVEIVETFAEDATPTANAFEPADGLDILKQVTFDTANAENQVNVIENANKEPVADSVNIIEAIETTLIPTFSQQEHQNEKNVDTNKEVLIPEALQIQKEVLEIQTTQKLAVRFDNAGNSIDEDKLKHHAENCQVKEDSTEGKAKTKKRKVKNQNSREKDSREIKTPPKIAVKFDSKGDSIDDEDHHGENCEVDSNEAKASTKKTRKRKGHNHDDDEDQIDSQNEASDDRRDESSHESDEDDGIPVITIPLGDILRKYARMMEGNNSEYEESESDERFVIRGYNDKKKDKKFIEL